MIHSHDFIGAYLEEQYELSSEWYNLQKNLIFMENKSLIENLPETLIAGVYTYLYGVRHYFDKMYEIMKREWNYFNLFYKKRIKEIKQFKKSKTSKQLMDIELSSLDVYGIIYDFDKKNDISYNTLSPTDKNTKVNLNVIRTLNKNRITTMKKNQITTEKFNEIRGTIVDKPSIKSEDFRKEVYKFYCDGKPERNLIEDTKLKNMDIEQITTIGELMRVKKEIDSFYKRVTSFLDEVKELEDLNSDKKLKQYTMNIDIKLNFKMLRSYSLAKTLEFRDLAQIYNTYFLTLLTVARDKINQDIEIINIAKQKGGEVHDE